MKKITLLLFVMVLFGGALLAQNTYNVVVFSEDGEPFFAFVNGIKQNDKPETNIRVTGLNSEVLNVRIVFENKANPQLKQNFMLEPGFEHTVTIKRNLKKVIKMRYFGKAPLSETVAGDVTTIPYHTTENTTPPITTKQESVNSSNTTTVITTKTETTGSPGNGNGSVTINMGGINMNVNTGSNPIETKSETVTSTTVISGSSNTTGTPPKTESIGSQVVVPDQGCLGVTTATEFTKIKKSISSIAFSDTKMSTAKLATKNNCLSVEQISEICKLFSMDDDRLEYAKYAYNYCNDKRNYYNVGSSFSFSTTLEEFNHFLEKK